MTCPDCERLKAQMQLDMDNFAADLAAKNRQIGKLKKELAEERGQEVQAPEVREVLDFWLQVAHKSKRTYTGADSKRWDVVRTALKRTVASEKQHDKANDVKRSDQELHAVAVKRVKRAIEYIAAHPFAGPRGRSAEQYPGSKRFDDVKYALGDEERQEEYERAFAELEKPIVLRPVHILMGGVPVENGPIHETDSGWWQLVREKRRAPDYVEQTREMKKVTYLRAVQSGPDPHHPTDPFEAFVTELERRQYETRRVRDRNVWAQCPGHNGTNLKLDITEKEGIVVMTCRSRGCTAQDVCAVLDYPMQWLWPADGLGRAA